MFYLDAMRIVDDIEQQIQQSEAETLFFVSDFAKAGNDVFIGRLLSEFAKKGLLCRTLSTILHHAGHHYSLSHKILEYALLVSKNSIDARWNVLRLSTT